MSLLLLESSLRARLERLPEAQGWHQLSEVLSDLLPDAPPTPGPLLAAVGALMRAGADLAEAYDCAASGYTAELGALATQDDELDAALGDVVLRWSCGAETSPVVRALLLGSLQENHALPALNGLLGSEAWSSRGPFGFIAPRLRQLNGQLNRPVQMERSLAEELYRPAEACPTSLRDQLRWILQAWAPYLSEDCRSLALLAMDLLEESQQHRGGGPGPIQLPGLGSVEDFADAGFVDQTPRFSEDADWMPRLVLIAKQAYVWLAQLSRQYGRDIQRLDQIPDEELKLLASRGFTGLWMIGLWERSPASRTIKMRCGTPDAESSAYSLRGYDIAERLGGASALEQLRERAASYGIRLAADMVPNHMGMDSHWMVDHPEWFLQLPHPPFPGYTFQGPDISGDDRISLYLEDGYWSQKDAAVVFKQVDRRSGQVRYVYHGNDGTQMPWNDTAQLDYLQAEVREAVIQTILGVARRFPMIRFDAAMTLARKHIARLWYPPAGQGGAIPSRAENSVPQEVFDRMVGGEFWREVVDRVRAEAPDTLLLAEAFWMMEGYFVRTLGMHRVYNSAFMHMLRDEDNGGYRGAIKAVLEYSPAILERYVNFMNNPDEETAVEQFGKGDKYFGIATLMATLPGLPMFGHGQFEGFTEKYGMEFTRPRHEEWPDQGLIDHHERVLVPLMRERHLFSGVEHFALLDFWQEDCVDENVFAYANRSADGSRPTLVLYNNSHEHTAGWLRQSTAINVGDTDNPCLVQRSLGEALGIERGALYGLWELRRGAWLLRRGEELLDQGLYAELGGYGAMVFMHVRAIEDPQGAWARLYDLLGGGWCSDLDLALEETRKVQGREVAELAACEGAGPSMKEAVVAATSKKEEEVP